MGTGHADAQADLETGDHGSEQLASFDLAQRAYAVYLQEYPQGKKSYDVHYQYAELLYKTKQYAPAYEQYVAVVEIDPNGKHSRFCAESAIFAADELVKEEQAANPTPKSKSVEPIALTLFQMVRESEIEPVLCELLRYYEIDEARHVALGIHYLPTMYRQQTMGEMVDMWRWQLKMIGISSAISCSAPRMRSSVGPSSTLEGRCSVTTP